MALFYPAFLAPSRKLVGAEHQGIHLLSQPSQGVRCSVAEGQYLGIPARRFSAPKQPHQGKLHWHGLCRAAPMPPLVASSSFLTVAQSHDAWRVRSRSVRNVILSSSSAVQPRANLLPPSVTLCVSAPQTRNRDNLRVQTFPNPNSTPWKSQYTSRLAL